MNNNSVFSFWVEGELDFHSTICIKSWLKLGYDVTIFKYEDINTDNNKFPSVVFKDARQFCERPPFNKPQEIADYFRFAKLLKTGGTWLDSDELLLKRLPEDEVIISSEHCKRFGAYSPKNREKTPNIGVLRFPPNPPIIAETMKRFKRQIKRGGIPENVNQNYNHLMKKFQAIILKEGRQLVSEPELYCPISWAYAKELYEKPDLWETKKFGSDPHKKFGIDQKQLQIILDKSYGIHLWRNLYHTRGYVDRPVNGSVFDKLCKMILDN